MSNTNNSEGANFTTLLLLAFIILKLCDVINWSWWWVLSPLWIPLGLAILLSRWTIAARKKEEKRRRENSSIRTWQKRIEEMQKKQKQYVDENKVQP